MTNCFISENHCIADEIVTARTPSPLKKGGVRLFCVAFICIYSVLASAQIPVWPGDANNDGIANHLDILNIGIGFGKQGNPRDSVNTTWLQQQVQAWNDSFPSGENLGYADCSGNGFVNIEDVSAIENNYGDTTPDFNGLIYLQGTTADPALIIMPHGSAFVQGEESSATVYLDQLSTDSVYGVAFAFQYDTAIIKQATVRASPHPQFGGGGRQPIFLQKNFADNGYLEFAISRTNGLNHGGNLSVCNVYFVIEDNLIGKSNLEYENAFRICNIRLFDREMNNIPVRGDTIAAKIMTGLKEIPSLPFNIYPVPASNWLFIDNYNYEKLVSIEMIDLKGLSYPLQTTEHDWSVMLDVSSLPQGIYVLRLVTENGVMNRKIVIKR